MAAPSSGIESIVPLPPSGYLSVAPPCLITYCGNHPPLRCERSSADTKDSVGFRVQWILPVLQRGRSASARRVLRNCLWCGIGYRVRDPGDSRRASLKLVLLVPMGDPGDSRDPDDSRRASLKRVRNRARLLLPEGLIPAFAPGLIEARTGRGAGRFRSFPVFVPGLSVAISQHPGVAIGRQSAVESCTGSSVFRGRPRRRSSTLVAAVVGCRMQRLGHQIGMLGRQSGALDLESRWRSEIPSSRASGYRPIPPRPRSRPASFLGTQNRRETGLEEVPPLARRLTRILRHHGPVVSNRTLRGAQRQPLARHPHLVAASRVLAHYLQVAAA